MVVVWCLMLKASHICSGYCIPNCIKLVYVNKKLQIEFLEDFCKEKPSQLCSSDILLPWIPKSKVLYANSTSCKFNLKKMGFDLDQISKTASVMNQEEFIDLMKKLSFEKLLNINILTINDLQLRKVIKLLIQISQNLLFYNYKSAVKFTIEFTLINFPIVLNGDLQDITLLMFDLLDEIINQIPKQKLLVTEFVPSERILNIFWKLIQLKTFNKTIAFRCTGTLHKIIQNSNDCELLMEKLLASIIQLIKFDVSSATIQILHHLQRKNKLTNDAIKQLLPFSNRICILSCVDDKVRPLVFKLMNTMILYYIQLPHTELILPKNYKIITELTKLPMELNQWPTNKTIFFYICHFLLDTSSLLWLEEDIFHSIRLLIYSINRFAIPTNLIKTICYLYNNLKYKQDKHVIQLGKEISRLVMDQKQEHINQIIALKSTENNWFVMNGSTPLKIHILSKILEEQQQPDDVITFIQHYKLENLLCDVLLKQNRPTTHENAIIVITRLNNDNLNEKLTLHLVHAFNSRNKEEVKRLVQCPLKIPQNTSISIKLCRIISCLLLELNGIPFENLLNFTIDLLIALKKEPKAYEYFCERLETLEKLFEYLKIKTFGHIFNICQLLLLHQKRHQTNAKRFVELKFIPDLNNVCTLDFVSLILGPNLLIRLNKSLILDLCCQLFNISIDNLELRKKSYNCLKRLLKNNTWLINSATFNMYLEISCSIIYDSVDLLELVALWINLSSDLLWNLCYLPKDSVYMFISRAEISKNKKRNLLNKMKFIMK